MNKASNAKSSRVIPLLIAVCLIGVSAEAQYSGGSGTAEDPYQIATAEDLIALGEEPNDYDKHFILTTDIDLSGFSFDRAVIAPDLNDEEVRFQGTDFTGIFDGNDHKISHLTIKGVDYLGLFGGASAKAEISDLELEAVNVNGTGRFVGGLVGDNDGSITRSHSSGTVTGNEDVGGLVGFMGSPYWGSITASHSSGTVSGGSRVGGLVGTQGAVFGGGSGSITTSYSTSTVSGSDLVGGLVGLNLSGTITNSYSTGTVSGSDLVGGLVGRNVIGSITTSYSTGSVTGGSSVGGLVGDNTIPFLSITMGLWDMEASGQATSAGGVGLTTAEMMDPYMLGLNGFANDPNWVLDAGRGYPRLAWEGTAGQIIPEPVIDWLDGQGTKQEPYRIETADQLIRLSRAGALWDKHFILCADIDLDPNLMGRRVFSQAVIQVFSGIFDGNGHTISHLTISGDSNLGLFGRLGPGAVVSNLALEEVNVNGNNFVGGLVGANDGSITTSYITGTVNGNNFVGGLVGDNSYYGSITTSYSTGSVRGEDYVGGLMGWNSGSITNCYITSTVNGNNFVGGLVGSGDPTLVYNSVWDMETSGLTVSAGGVGLTTAEMMDPYTLGLNGFANDPNWVLDAGRDYPRLAWEGTAGEIIPEPVIDWLDGKGTEEEPYRVDTVGQLILLRGASGLWDKHFILCADIDLDPNLPGRQVFSQAMIQVFSGVFDGNGHIISHLTIVGDSHLGLFGRLGPGAIISNLALEALNVNGTGGNVGGLAGWNDDGSITASYSTGSVSGDRYVGGLVGSNSDGSITASYSTCSVRGDHDVGGLVGENEGSITSSYGTGPVTGGYRVGGLVGGNGGSITASYSSGTVSGTDHYVGGLVGENDGSISNSYNIGRVGGGQNVGGLVGVNYGSITASYSSGRVSGDRRVGGLVGVGGDDVTSSFWDIKTNGLTISDGGTGADTGWMHLLSTYLDAGWDFVDETTNGTDDIWWIPEGLGYPRLWWENLYVDDDAPDDPGPGDPQISDPLEDGRQTHPFDTIQEAIDFAHDSLSLTVLVRAGVYREPIDFKGKAITVTSMEATAVIQAPGLDAVTFHTGEGPDSVLKNLVVSNSGMAISLNYGSSPTIRNITIANNDFGVAAYDNSKPDISNCILWNNRDGDLFGCQATYSCIEDGSEGEGNISVDPLFVDVENGDYHLRSEGWCWSTTTKSWTYDYVTSPCIDAGNPGSPLGDEPMSVPRDPDNLWGVNLRINMGAFGGTSQASIAPRGDAVLADLDNDGRVNYVDLARQAEDWLRSASEQAGDLNRDGVVNMADFAAFAGNWLGR